MDDTAWAMLCDPKERADSGSAATIRTAAGEIRRDDQPGAGRPAGRHGVTMHSCRGNFRSTLIAEAATSMLPMLLGGELDGYFLEDDTDRAGGFEPLRFVPKGKKQIVPGLVTLRAARWRKRTHQAAHRRGDQYVALDQSCLSPQCGFASTEEGNVWRGRQWASCE